MVHPRIVRTPSEERQYRKEARLVRIRKQTEEQRAIARSKHAALQRRRRQDAALREREKEARRRRRARTANVQRALGQRTCGSGLIAQVEADKRRASRAKRGDRGDEVVRQRKAEAKRRRRQDPEIRQLEAAKRRARRQDEVVRQREAEAKRRRRQNPEIRQLEAAKRRARREDLAVRLREAEDGRRRRQNQREAKEEASQAQEADWQSRLRQRTQLSKGQNECCDACFCPAFEEQLSPIDTTYVSLLAVEFPNEDVDSFVLCSLCHAALRARLRNIYAHPVNATGLCVDHFLCSSDYEDTQSLVHSCTQENYQQQAGKAKVDCCLQTDGTGKIHCLVQTEDTLKRTAELSTDKCTRVIAVQTEEWPWLQFCESTCGDTEDESEYPVTDGIKTEDWL
ncbi:arginine and glutamate-rich protein 1-B isoform X1 [Rhipicephalus sanguineus]|uniref:arginine and glutamate-rich protein 1-B isoform X1 n=1 Tax=Rhipicephalus sanguineus TaxID=34632 RepID=UPI0018952869|nr:arginine and glutamate-rich protein 1-B isoform X1 [Rhipicephalus sanguineus]